MSGSASMPERIGRFHIRSMLGRGAMGVVYLGHDEEIDRLVAIKLIRADLLDTEERESYLKRFRNEAKIAGRCMHANIVGLYDFAMHDENPYLVMEYIDGIGLQQFFPRGSKRPVHEVIHIALQVLDALHYAHGRSIVHRDIKPANILMMPDLSLKITDFGISRLTSMELTVTPLLIGTPSYMSPEQCLGSALDGRNDLFSLGCVLYELVAGERAFGGVNYTETIFSIVNKPHRPLSQIVPDLLPGFSDAIDKALAKSPEQRHMDAASFARVLDDIARESRMPRSGMPPVIADAGRMPPGKSYVRAQAASLAETLSGWTRSIRPSAEDPQPTVSVSAIDPTTPARTASMAGIASPAGPGEGGATVDRGLNGQTAMGASVRDPGANADDPDATLMRTLHPHMPIQGAADGTEPGPGLVPEPVPAPPPASTDAQLETLGDEPETVRNEQVSMVAVDDGRSQPPFAHPEPGPPFDGAQAAHPADFGTVSFTPGPHYAIPTPVGDADRLHIVDCLATVIGPIAPLLARRVEQPGMSAAALADALSVHVRRLDERQQFHALLDGNARLSGGPSGPSSGSISGRLS